MAGCRSRIDTKGVSSPFGFVSQVGVQAPFSTADSSLQHRTLHQEQERERGKREREEREREPFDLRCLALRAACSAEGPRGRRVLRLVRPAARLVGPELRAEAAPCPAVAHTASLIIPQKRQVSCIGRTVPVGGRTRPRRSRASDGPLLRLGGARGRMASGACARV